MPSKEKGGDMTDAHPQYYVQGRPKACPKFGMEWNNGVDCGIMEIMMKGRQGDVCKCVTHYIHKE
jgi:hypothetical protein